jgi:hypothetical protein
MDAVPTSSDRFTTNRTCNIPPETYGNIIADRCRRKHVLSASVFGSSFRADSRLRSVAFRVFPTKNVGDSLSHSFKGCLSFSTHD